MLEQLTKKFKRLSLGLEKKAIVLCYHRIANQAVDPWNISVSPRNFEEHLEVLATDFNVTHITDLVTNFDKVAKRKTVCISFDDGYADNYATARPLLKNYNLPACFFIASSFLGTEQLFWWDELAEIILTAPALPVILSLQAGQLHFSFDLKDCAVLGAAEQQKIKSWKYYDKAPSGRCDLFLKLWEMLRPLPSVEQEIIMNELRTWSGHLNEADDLEKLPMTEPQLQELAKDSLFTIGLHTLHHSALGYHPAEVQENEILGNQSHLQSILKKKIDILSFPYGSYNGNSIGLAEKHALKASFTSQKRMVMRQYDRYSIGRYAVKDWNGKLFKSKLNTWFSKTDG